MEPTKNSCPWAQTSADTLPVEPVSFIDVMSEQKAKDLQLEEEEIYWESLNPMNLNLNDFKMVEDQDCKNDQFLAQLLQMEFDKQHDTELARAEKFINGNCKVSLSFDKFRCLPDGACSSDDEDDLQEDILSKKHWDSFEKEQKSSPTTIGKSGIAGQGSAITTKHDANLCGRRNARRVMEFRSGISTGDASVDDLKLPNHVFNSLKVHSKNGEKRAQRVQDKKEKATSDQVLDPKTRLILYKMINNQILDSINGCFSTGKESVVFHATGGQSELQVVPAECAIKVFKTTLNEFKNRDKYIREDYRFRDRFGKQNPRKIIHLWAEKEMHNLTRMHKAGIPCPEVIILKKHALVMTFIGKDRQPAPKLKEVALSPLQMLDAYNQTVEILKKLYRDCNLVHADLSEYNLLWHENKIWVIDVSQSVEPSHPNALEFLFRDCNNISKFFSKNSVPDVLEAKDLFKETSGLEIPGEGAEFLSQIQSYEKNEELLCHRCADRSDVFDSLFNQQVIPAEITNPSKIPIETAN